jgi:ABC-type nitrate/sulfonate/bicarbonate transport system ATPase subunit
VATLMPEIVVSVREKRFPGMAPELPKLVLRDVAFQVSPGEFVAIVGPSGCGKTTLLNIVAGLDPDFVGRIDVRSDAAPPRIGYVFQNPRLLPWRTVWENVAIVLPKGVDPAAVDQLLHEVGLSEARNVFASRLSVGMSRRAAIARALVIQPNLVLMDEPFVSLEEAMAQRLRQLLLQLLQLHPTSVLFVTHDLREAVALADRILLLSPAPGRLIADFPISIPREKRDAAAIESARDTIRQYQQRLPHKESG